MYTFMMDSGKEKKTAKGLKKSVKDREFKHRDFIRLSLQESPSTRVLDGFQIRLCSDLH